MAFGGQGLGLGVWGTEFFGSSSELTAKFFGWVFWDLKILPDKAGQFEKNV